MSHTRCHSVCSEKPKWTQNQSRKTTTRAQIDCSIRHPEPTHIIQIFLVYGKRCPRIPSLRCARVPGTCCATALGEHIPQSSARRNHGGTTVIRLEFIVYSWRAGDAIEWFVCVFFWTKPPRVLELWQLQEQPYQQTVPVSVPGKRQIMRNGRAWPRCFYTHFCGFKMFSIEQILELYEATRVANVLAWTGSHRKLKRIDVGDDPEQIDGAVDRGYMLFIYLPYISWPSNQTNHPTLHPSRQTGRQETNAQVCQLT